MVNFRENSALAFKYIYWGLIIVGLFFVVSFKLFAWGGFTEPIDVSLHLEPHQEEFNGEKWLKEHMEKEKEEKAKDESKDRKKKK